jgi:adenylate cyclase
LKQPWSDEYERKLADVFAVQDEIAMAVANALQVTLGVGAIAEIPGMTRNVEAYDEDLKGNALFQLYTPDSVRQAVEHLRRAVFLDPKFARAWLDLATLYTNGGLVVPDQAAAWQELAVGAGENAQKAAPDSPYVALTNLELKARDGRWLEAGRIYQDYLPLAVKYGLQKDDWMGGGLFLLRVGKVHDAIAALELAKSANPLSSRVAANLVEAYSDAGSSDAGKLAQSLQEFDRGLRLRGNEGVLRAAGLFAALATGDRDEIRKRLAATGSSRELGELLDDPAAALDRIRQMAKQAGNNLWDYGSLAVWAAYYSDPELALDLQRKFVSVNKSFVATTSLWRPIFRDVRKLPGFKDLVHRMGLVDYWRANGWNDFCRQVGDEDFECTGPWP